jgi:aspartate dehydrogenase
MIRAALIGCGAIGTTLARAIDSGKAGEVRLLEIFDLKEERMRELKKKLKHKPRIVYSFEDLLKNKETSLVIEAASQQAVRDYLLKILASGKDVIVMSVGALLDQGFCANVRKFAERRGRKIYIPSGAIGGIDAIKAAKLGGIRRVILKTRKNPKSLGIDPKDISKAMRIYKGEADQASKLFPKNVNVGATLSLAGIGARETSVEIWADPRVRKNIHEIYVSGAFGELCFRVRNVISKLNPKTSYLACLSAIMTLRKLSEPFQIGT